MKRDPFLGLLLLVARAHGATSDQIERALAGDSSREAQAELLDRLRRNRIRVTRRHPPLTRFAVAGLSRAAMEGISRLGVKTNRDLFLETEERLRTAGGLGDAEIGEIERFARRSGYRLGMTAEEANAREKELEEIFETSMETVGFSTRIANALANLGIVSLGGVCALSETRLLKLRNFGRKSLEELQSKLGRRGVGLGMIVPGMDDPLRSVWP